MFEGFCPETIDFLWGIQLNNDRAWFQAHKKTYLDTLYEPMKALGEAVYEPFRDTPGLMLHVSRIYRDARYAHGLPYKDSLWLSIRHDEGYWAQLPCLYFDLHPDYYSFGFGVVSPTAAAMQTFRDDISARPDHFLDLAETIRAATGLEIGGDAYRRAKPCPDARLRPYFQLKNIICSDRRPISQELFEPALADEVAKTLLGLMPLYDYCRRITGGY